MSKLDKLGLVVAFFVVLAAISSRDITSEKQVSALKSVEKATETSTINDWTSNLQPSRSTKTFDRSDPLPKPQETPPAELIYDVEKSLEAELAKRVSSQSVAPELNTTTLQSNQTSTLVQVIPVQPVIMYVDANRLNVRSAPSKQGRVVWTLKREQGVRVVSRSGEWLGLQGDRFSGWVFGTYLTPKPRPQNVRQSVPQNTNIQLSVAAVKRILIARSLSGYRGNCPCPYNRTARGSKCGGRSAWSRPGGEEPLCYPTDITAGMVADYQARQ